ncbi:MAG: DNA polymerase III subunit beta [bacterium]|nr:DNA polymerase III subunit beta [bacterium]
MRYSVPQDRYLTALERAASVVPSKTTMPILRTVHIAVQKNEMAVSATDLELILTARVPVDAAEEGTAVVPARRLLDLARVLPSDQPVRIEDESGHYMVIHAGQGKFRIAGEEPALFPQLPVLPPDPVLKVPSSKLRRIIDKTLFAVATDELRPVLNGVLFQLKSGKLRVVSTDGHRLVKWVDTATTYQAPDFDWIVPKRALEVLSKLVDSGKEMIEVEVFLAQNQLHFKVDAFVLSTRLIDGKFPMFDSVIPTNNPNFMTAEVKPFLSAVKRVSVFSGSLTKHIRIDLKQSEIVLQAEDPEGVGRGMEPLTVEYSGEAFTIGYNSSFLEKVLSQVDCAHVKFELSGSSGAGVVKPTEQADGEDLLMLLMPVRLS